MRVPKDKIIDYNGSRYLGGAELPENYKPKEKKTEVKNIKKDGN